jgi:hypothetical protein
MGEPGLQALSGMEALATGQTALAALVERSLTLTEAQYRELLAEVRGNREAVLSEQRALLHATQLQTAAIEAQTRLLRELGQGALSWLQTRWLSLLLGLAVGLGLSGARTLLDAALGALLGSAP